MTTPPPTPPSPPSPAPPSPLPPSAAETAGSSDPASEHRTSWSLPPPRDDPPVDPRARPVWIGPYRLLEPLGEGGFGVVYLAERREPFFQRVALKILKPGIDSAAIVARFEQERQALALMDHPGIARVLDGGLTPPDSPLGPHRPYFVMELVVGRPINRYCNEHTLGLRERLDLFLAVCDAVQHAHMKGVIHRDLKPGNILVAEATTAEGTRRPIPKVIDFGIARAVGGSLTDKTIFTERGQIIGTPEYMPPEQAALDTGPGGLDIDTRADVYSLGVVLYELLAGILPFEPAELRRGGLLEIARIIREVEPPRPSTRVSQAVRNARAASHPRSAGSRPSPAPSTPPAPAPAPAPAGHASPTTLRIRGVEPATLVRALRGDLDWIVMKAIEKSRARRYETPSALAADLRRYLRLEPVEAGPPSAAYRLAKFVKRRRLPILAAAACAIALIAGLAAALQGQAEARRQRDAALIAGARAEGALRVLTDAIGSINPHSFADPVASRTLEQVPASRLFTQILDDLEAAPPADPEVDLSVRAIAGQALVGLGEIERAERELAAVMTSLETENRRDDPRYAQAAFGLGAAHLRAMRPGLALELADRTLPILDTRPDHALIRADLLRTKASALVMLGRRAEAEPLVREAIDVIANDPRAGPLRLADSMTSLAEVLAGRDDDAAMRAAEAALKINLAHQPRSLATVALLRNIGGLHETAGRLDDAAAHYRQAADLAAQGDFRRHLIVADVQHRLAKMLRNQGLPDEAYPLATEALHTRRALAGAGSPLVARSLDLLGGIASDRADHARAAELYNEAVAILRAASGASPADLASLQTALASALTALGRFTDAEPHAREALEWRSRPGTPPFLVASTRSVLGAALAGQGRDAEAEPLLVESAQAVARDERIFPRRRAAIVQRAVDFLRARGRDDELAEWQVILDDLLARNETPPPAQPLPAVPRTPR